MELRPAQQHEAGMCYQCIEDARAYHKSLGFEQWHPDYPTQQTIFDDIARGIGYVFSDGTGVIGYSCIVIGDEPAYHEIDGAWKTDRPYAVVHRMAFNRRARVCFQKHKPRKKMRKYAVSQIKPKGKEGVDVEYNP